MKFDHVEDRQLRDLLENGWNGDEDTVCCALTYSAECVAADSLNELLDYRVVDARADALAEAEHAWNSDGDGFEAVEQLRKLWLI
jgi:hypothetical protein